MDYIYIGKLTGTHGLKGELKLKSSFIYLDRVLKNNFTFYIGDNFFSVNLLRYRYHNGFYLLTFCDFLDINLVDDFRNKKIYINRLDLCLGENEYLHEDYIGLSCYFNDNFIGSVTDIQDCGNGNYVLLISGLKDILIPLNDVFIDEVVLGDRIVFKDVEGLIDAN